MFDLEKINATTKDILALQEGESKDTFLRQVVEVIADNLKIHFVGIYLMDEQKGFVWLKAGSGRIGEALLKHSHRVKIGEHRDFGWQAGTSAYLNEARLTNWVAGNIVGYKTLRASNYETYLEGKLEPFCSPILPLTKSELFFPIRIDEKVFGVLELNLDIVLPEFSKDEILQLQLMADQTAMALV